MNVVSFLSGIYMATFAASGLVFFKFYKASGDRFFRFFGYACWLLALERIALLFISDPTPLTLNVNSESQSWMYLIRLVAFLIILFAIIDKNRSESSPEDVPKE